MYGDDRLYSKEHEWIKVEGSTATLGITNFAQDELGDVVFVELPEVGASFSKNDEIGTIESVKAVSSLYTPASGEITAVNEVIADRPEIVNEEPHGDGWLVKIELADPEDVSDLMSAAEYQEHIEAG